MQMSRNQEGIISEDPEVKKQELHMKLSTLVNELVNKIQAKHECLIEKQQELAKQQVLLKEKYNPIFD